MAELDSVDAQIATNGAYAQAEAFVARNMEEFEGTLPEIEAIAAIVDALGTVFAANRLNALTAVVADYPARKRGGGGNPNWKGGKAASSSDGVTGPQRGLIETLVNEKAGVADVFDGNIDALNKRTASDTIEALMVLEDA